MIHHLQINAPCVNNFSPKATSLKYLYVSHRYPKNEKKAMPRSMKKKERVAMFEKREKNKGERESTQKGVSHIIIHLSTHMHILILIV